MTTGRRWRLVRAACLAIALAFVAAAMPDAARAQTLPRGVPADRPDQLRTRPSAPRIRPAAPRPRDPLAAFRPFMLSDVVVTGSSLPAPRLASAYRAFLGRTVDNRALAALTTALAAVYERSDIALYTVLVPEQDFGGGTVRLTVIEGHVARIDVRGTLRGKRLALLQAYLRRVVRERPLHVSTLQRAVSLVRDMPGVTATPSFEPGDTQGGVTLVLPVSEKPVQVVLGADNRGTAFLGRTKFQADALFNGVFGGADQLRATVVVPAHTRRFQYYAGAYRAPLDADGTAITGTLSYLRTRPAVIPLEGDATSFGVQVTHAFVKDYGRTLSATVGLDGIDTNNALLGLTLSNDRVRTLRFASAYTTAGRRNQLTLSATASFGLAVAGARVTPGQARRDFRKLNARISDTIQIGKALALRLNAFGQASADDLPSSEQIALGGDEFGRAYQAALITGDDGYAGSAELAWIPSRGVPAALTGSELYLYSDGGHVTYRSRPGFDAASFRLASAGAGVRLHIAEQTIVQVEGARGLSRPAVYGAGDGTRVVFSIRTVP